MPARLPLDFGQAVLQGEALAILQVHVDDGGQRHAQRVQVQDGSSGSGLKRSGTTKPCGQFVVPLRFK